MDPGLTDQDEFQWMSTTGAMDDWASGSTTPVNQPAGHPDPEPYQWTMFLNPSELDGNVNTAPEGTPRHPTEDVAMTSDHDPGLSQQPLFNNSVRYPQQPGTTNIPLCQPRLHLPLPLPLPTGHGNFTTPRAPPARCHETSAHPLYERKFPVTVFSAAGKRYPFQAMFSTRIAQSLVFPHVLQCLGTQPAALPEELVCWLSCAFGIIRPQRYAAIVIEQPRLRVGARPHAVEVLNEDVVYRDVDIYLGRDFLAVNCDGELPLPVVLEEKIESFAESVGGALGQRGGDARPSSASET